MQGIFKSFRKTFTLVQVFISRGVCCIYQPNIKILYHKRYRDRPLRKRSGPIFFFKISLLLRSGSSWIMATESHPPGAGLSSRLRNFCGRWAVMQTNAKAKFVIDRKWLLSIPPSRGRGNLERNLFRFCLEILVWYQQVLITQKTILKKCSGF